MRKKPSPFVGPDKEPRRMYMALDAIDVSEDRRKCDEATVESLVRSIQEVGLLHPIAVREYFDVHGDQHIDLVSGRKRLEALRRLGIIGMDCLVINDRDNPLIAELVEIDENLCRANLSAAQEAAAIARRKIVYEALHPETKHGTNQHSRSEQNAHSSSAMRFTAATSQATGQSEHTVRRAAARGKAIGADNLAKIANTSLDKGTELDALAAKPAAEREELIERAAAGEKVTATRGNDVDPSAPAPIVAKAENAKLIALASLCPSGSGANVELENELARLRQQLKEARSLTRAAKSGQTKIYNELRAENSKNAELRGEIAGLQRENAELRAIVNDPDRLRERIEMLAAMKERQALESVTH